MARMYPPRVFSGIKSPGEAEVFDRLKTDPDSAEWIILHSLDIPHHNRQLAGEIDFVIIVPRKGVLCLEVKACSRVRRIGGLWYFGTNPIPDPRGPFKQASDAMHSLRKRVSKRNPGLARVLFWSAVLFPYVDFSIESSEWHEWQAIGLRQFRSRSMGRIVADVLDNARNFVSHHPSGRWFRPDSGEPDPAQCEIIASILRPDFEFFESPASRAQRRDDELKHYTAEQFDALDAMEANPRVVFEGPAGTGKTLLAIEAARRACAEGRRVLLLCFNRLLGAWLQEQVSSLRPSVKASTLHSFMLSVAGIHPPEQPRHEFWTDLLPKEAAQKMLSSEMNGYQVDELIIDEAQDILHHRANLDFLDLCLKGGLLSGIWKLFGDFERQAIYGRPRGGIEDALISRLGNPPRYSLRINCRNTPRIAELVRLFADLEPGYTKIRRPDNGIEPDIYLYKNRDYQQRLLVQVLQALRSEGFANSDIVVLSARAAASCPTLELEHAEEGKFCELGSGVSGRGIGYGTIHSFKGLESPVVVLIDIKKVISARARALLYVGITRALEKLVILVSENAREEMLEILSGKSP